MDLLENPASAIIQRLLTAYHWHKITITTAVFSFSWTWWEYAITLDDEISLIWQSRWSWIKFLFLVNRYLVLFSQTFDVVGYLLPKPTYNFCLAWVGYITVINGTLQVFIADIVLIIRLGAIYGRKKRIVVPVIVLYILTVAASSTVLGIQAHRATGTNEPVPGFFLCSLTSKLNILYAYWVPIAVFESIMFLLAAYRVISDFNVPKMESAYGPRSLLSIVVRDSLWYFVVVLTTGLANALEYRFASPGKYNVLHGPTSAALSISMSRVILNLRKTGRQENPLPTLQLSVLRFQAGRTRGTTIDTGDDGMTTTQAD
ncbi:uncharacterized protein BT62DRAFT_936949 [Guyanagaster necrorhizus]|uniref:DUF6533 domain-containing protein n=1 Tax=Guyanagaster necrorhizus TaxID=856835 RepID=A0A9P7VJ53_9AGAR|nr:uncharacterized protein BT62DRAFT_936949 [Guyanagaster necrorhizus MCA 3950]KAG7441639.1 hypothetical protein BT62DRAFT_936949 [Guyanagaster necrorhizus MCA 3950]